MRGMKRSRQSGTGSWQHSEQLSRMWTGSLRPGCWANECPHELHGLVLD